MGLISKYYQKIQYAFMKFDKITNGYFFLTEKSQSKMQKEFDKIAFCVIIFA